MIAKSATLVFVLALLSPFAGNVVALCIDFLIPFENVRLVLGSVLNLEFYCWEMHRDFHLIDMIVGKFVCSFQ